MTFDDLLTRKPTLEWKERMDDDDDFFTEENIEETSVVLDDYLISLKRLDHPTEEDILSCVEKVVFQLNDLNEEHDFFIETVEREELYEFITEAAKLAGLHMDEDEDITEEWREW